MVASVIGGGTFAQGAVSGAIGGAIGGAIQGITTSEQFQNAQAGYGFKSNADTYKLSAISSDMNNASASASTVANDAAEVVNGANNAVTNDFCGPENSGAEGSWSPMSPGEKFINNVSLNGNATFSAPGELRPALRFGFSVSMKGVDVYNGVGIGAGDSVSLSISYSSVQSTGISVIQSFTTTEGIYGGSVAQITNSNFVAGRSYSVSVGAGTSVYNGAQQKYRVMGF